MIFCVLLSLLVGLLVGGLIGIRLKSNYETLNQMLDGCLKDDCSASSHFEKLQLAQTIWGIARRETLVSEWELQRLAKQHRLWESNNP